MQPVFPFFLLPELQLAPQPSMLMTAFANDFKVMVPFELGIPIDALNNGPAIFHFTNSVLTSSSASSPANGSVADLNYQLASRLVKSFAFRYAVERSREYSQPV